MCDNQSEIGYHKIAESYVQPLILLEVVKLPQAMYMLVKASM